MSDLTVTVIDPIHPSGIARLREKYRVVDLSEAGSDDARALAIAGADAIVVRTFRIDEPVLKQASRLKLVVKHGSGVDNIDIPAATRHGVLVANTPGGANATSVAEGAVALMLAVLRRVREMDACVREGRFNARWRVQLSDLWGKRVGLVGFGRIGRIAARICGAGFNARVMSYDPFVSAAEMAEWGAGKIDDLLELAASSDILSVHVPLSETTRDLVDDRVLRSLPEHAILVNTSRGGTVDEAALIEVLRQRRIAGAGIDVFEDEPPRPDNKLFALDNVVLSPHVAGVTDGSLRGTAVAVAEVIESVFSGRKPDTLLNDSVWKG